MVPASRPEREVPARGVPGYHRLSTIGRHKPARRLRDQLRQPVGGGRDVVKGARPPAAWLSGPAVLRGAYSESGLGERLGERPVVLAPVLGAPEAAVQEDDQRNPRISVASIRNAMWRQMHVGNL